LKGRVKGVQPPVANRLFVFSAFFVVKPFRAFGVFRAGESRISGGDKKDLLNHVFIQDPFLVSVGME
jgi:hypothetical protein